MKMNTDHYIPFSRPSIGAEEETAVLKVLRSGWLTTAGEASAFEEEFARFIGVPYALALNSATAGLHLSLEALKLPKGTGIITTPYTFAASAEAARHIGCHPIFADIEAEGCNIDPEEIEKVLQKSDLSVGAVIPVHVAGQPCNMEEIMKVCSNNDIPVIEDAAHALPARTSLGPAGTIGKTGVFSFYATKNITTGEGGMVTTGDKEVAERIKLMRLHGIDRDIWDRYTGKNSASWYYEVKEAGFKYNLSDLAASIGRVQLKKCITFYEKRKTIAEKYIDAFSGLDYLKIPEKSAGHSWHLFIITLEPKKLTIGRDRFIEELGKREIGTSVHFIPLHIMPYYRKNYNYKPEDFPRSLYKYRYSLSLPIYPDLSEEEAERICKAVKAIGDRYYNMYY